MATDIKSLVSDLEANIAQVVLGKPEVVRLSVVTLLAGEHVLLEDVPGVGKTLVAKALAKSVSGDFCAHPVHARPAAQRHRRQQRLQRARRASSSSTTGRSSPTSCWPTRSTARRRGRKARCWKR